MSKSCLHNIEFKAGRQSAQERAPAAITGKSLKSLAQCTAAAGKATIRYRGTTRKDPGYKTDVISGPPQRIVANPQLMPCVKADLVPCISVWAER